jgi:hypothetical protein
MKVEEIKKNILHTYFAVWSEQLSLTVRHNEDPKNTGHNHTLCILGNILRDLGVDIQEEIDMAKEKFPILEWLQEDVNKKYNPPNTSL